MYDDIKQNIYKSTLCQKMTIFTSPLTPTRPRLNPCIPRTSPLFSTTKARFRPRLPLPPLVYLRCKARSRPTLPALRQCMGIKICDRTNSTGSQGHLHTWDKNPSFHPSTHRPRLCRPPRTPAISSLSARASHLLAAVVWDLKSYLPVR